MFILGNRSRVNLVGVSAHLVAVPYTAIQLTEVDFAVICGVRTKAEQMTRWRNGFSQVTTSRHETGHAFDAAAYVDGSIDWHLEHYYAIAEAVRDAAIAYKLPIRWGGCWQVINEIEDLRQAVADYSKRRRAAGKKPFIDAGHFERPEG